MEIIILLISSYLQIHGLVRLKRILMVLLNNSRTIDYGLRAGMQLLRGYIARGFDTPAKILNRFAPKSENNTNRYLDYVCDGSLHPDDNLSVNSLNFYNLCAKICMYESKYDFKYDDYVRIKLKFRI